MTSVMAHRTKSDHPWDAVSTSHLLHRVQQLASDRFSYLVGENGVTLRQYVVMTAVAETPGISQIDLVRSTGIDRSTLADLIARLERRGLIARKPSEADARANALELTEAGVETLTNARQHAKAADAAILDALPRTKRKTFQSTLARLAKHADDLDRKAEHEAKRQAKRDAKERARLRKREMAANDSAPESPTKTGEKRKPRRKAGAR